MYLTNCHFLYYQYYIRYQKIIILLIFIFLLLHNVYFTFFVCLENVVVVSCLVKEISMLCLVIVLCFGHHVKLNFASVFLFLGCSP